MKIELKRISHNKRLSEETHAYSADLYVDGVKVAEVSNHGHGGADYVYWSSKDVTEKQVEAWVAANHPPLFYYEGKPHAMTLESLCCNLVNDWLQLKDWTRMLKTKVVAIDGENVVTWNLKRLPTAADIENIKHHNPKYAGLKFLNGMTEQQLIETAKATRVK